MQTKQQKLSTLNEQIIERTAYLKSIEDQIAQVSDAGNNKLFELHGDINRAEKELAKVLYRSYEIDQQNREKANSNL